MDTSNTALNKDFTWISSHLILLAVVALLVFGGVYGVESLLSRRAAANDAKWEYLLKEQTAQTQTIQQQLTQDEKQWAQVVSKLTAQNVQLAATVNERDRQLQQQEKQNATLTAQEAAERLAAQTHAEQGEVTVAGNSVVLDLPVTRRVVDSLDSLSTTQADLEDTKQQLVNETQIAVTAQDDVAEQKTLVAAQQKQLATAQQTCKAQISDLKAKQRKNILKTIFIGLGIGIGIGAHYF